MAAPVLPNTHANTIMALANRGANASIDSIQGISAPKLSALTAGEALDALAPCYIGADELVYMSDGTADDAAAKCAGFTPKSYGAGEPVSLFGPGTRAEYGTGLSVGPLYVAATAGRLDTAPTTGGTAPVARAINSHEIQVIAYTA